MYIAGDRRVASDSSYFKYPVAKVANKHGVLIGGAGRMSLMEEILYGCEFPKKLKSQSDAAYIRKTIYSTIFNYIKDLEDSLDSEDRDITFLIGYAGVGFELDLDDKGVDFGMVELPYSIGSGAPYARGALAALKQGNTTEQERLMTALSAAASCDTGCSFDCDILIESINRRGHVES